MSEKNQVCALVGELPALYLPGQNGTPPDQNLPTLVLLAALEDPDSGLLILDSELRVRHATSQIWGLLEIYSFDFSRTPEFSQFLTESALDAGSAALAKDLITAFQRGDDSAESVLLHKVNASNGVYMKLRKLGPVYLAVSFTPNLPGRAAPVVSKPVSLDSLTGIATRAHFEESLRTALSADPLVPLSVILIDLDRFKAVNDTLGHGAGDTLLQLVSKRLQSSVRKCDVVSRFGGDEFAVLVHPSKSREEPIKIAKRILDLVQRTYLIEGQLVNIGTSIGIAQAPEDATEAIALIRNADLALYHSKNTGRGAFHFFDVSMNNRAMERRTSELELRRALALRQLELHYQPQVNTPQGRLVGFEALIRWRHPERGLIPPGDFLPLAEEIGLMVPIGDWVLRTACKEAMKWPRDVTIAVNASPLQFDTGKFADSVRQALQATGLPGDRLEIEITEGILLRNDEATMKTLHELQSMKVRIAMDDFGTGYASLSQLARFPFDKIKIDRSLAGFEGDDLKQRAIVRAITALGQSLGVCTLAEGVENAEQLARLEVDGCSSVQGYFFGKAVPASELSAVILNLCPKTEEL